MERNRSNMTDNERNFEDFMTEYDKKKKQTIVWRVFSTLCLIAIIVLIIFRAMHCDCDCQKKAQNDAASVSYSDQAPEDTTTQQN